jgi:hypothetical protein
MMFPFQKEMPRIDFSDVPAGKQQEDSVHEKTTLRNSIDSSQKFTS